MAKNRNEITSTELCWPGKETEVERVVLPFQTVETVNEPRVDQPRMDFGEWPENYPRDWRNKLIWGDNKYVMASLLKDFAGKINLIYIDPPFATGADFTVEVEIGDAEVTKEPSAIEELAYRDTWGINVDGKWVRGTAPYLQMMYERLVLMKELLADEGSIYVHLDYRVDSHVRLLLDEIFGRDNLINEVIWNYVSGGISKRAFARKHDTLYFYAKEADAYKFHYLKERKDKFRDIDESECLEDEKGKFVWYIRPGTNPKVPDGVKTYIDGFVQDVWQVPIVNPQAQERLGFPTQKPEALLRRIIKASSDAGDLVADFFCGSGTTGAVAEKLGGRWIMCDLSRFAIQTTRKRLLNLHNYSKDYDKPARPFEILNMGNYQKHKFIENKHPPVEQYIKFILELYRAQPLEGLSFVHGKKGKRLVHVAGVDSIVTEREVRDTAEECVNALGGKAIDILGWDFEMGLDELVGRISEEYEADIKLVQIPREAMELRSAAQDIRFFEMNYLDVAHRVEGKKLRIELKDFIIANMEYLPDEVRDNVKSFTDYIDYWAVDFDYRQDTFHNMWQSFRTRKRKKLDVACAHVYDRPGRYQVLIKVIDVFGNDTNKLLEVNV